MLTLESILRSLLIVSTIIVLIRYFNGNINALRPL
jgi:hypothetical protein